jgi:hypothetical protein
MFRPYSPGTGEDHSILLRPFVLSGATISVGEAVKLDPTYGCVTNATAGAPILGIVVGFTGPYENSLTPGAYAPGSATSSDVTTVTAASSTQYRALVEASKNKQWSVDVNGTLGTTAHSDAIGAGINVDSANTNYGRVLETTATRTAATVTNFLTLGVDPNDSTRVIVKIASSQLDRNVS